MSSLYKRLNELKADLALVEQYKIIHRKYQTHGRDTQTSIEEEIKKEKEYLRRFEEDLASLRFTQENPVKFKDEFRE